MDKADRVPLAEALKLSWRAYKVWWQKCPAAMALAVTSNVISSLTPFVAIFISARLINEIAGNRDPDVLWFWVFAALISTAAIAAITAVVKRLESYHSSAKDLVQAKLFSDKMLEMDFCDVGDTKTHNLLSQIRQNDNFMGWGLRKTDELFSSLISATASLIGALSLTVTLFTSPVPDSAGRLVILNNPIFIFAIILLLAAVTIVPALLSSKAESYWIAIDDEFLLGNRFFNFFAFIAYELPRALDIRTYGQQKLIRKFTADTNSKLYGTKSKFMSLSKKQIGLLSAAGAAVAQVFSVLAYIFVGLKAWGGAFGVGSVTQYVGAIATLSGGVSDFITSVGGMRNNALYLRMTFEFLDIPNNMYQGSLTTEKRADHEYEIEFNNVSFKYPGTDNYALKNVSLKFNIGQRLAIVGENGSGKTTLIKLLCRLYDPTEGEILLNGIDIRKYDYAEYTAIYSVVFQDFKLLAGTLGQNVAAASAYDGSLANVCLDKAGFTERMEKMTSGLDTFLYKDFEEDGVDISGGEAQKIALARALYKDAHFAVLDEPTAALDPVAEYEVYTKMNEIVGEKTAVFISHRLSSCRFCADIAVFHEGALIQRGSHDELLSVASGKYNELWNAQAQYYTESEPQGSAAPV